MNHVTIYPMILNFRHKGLRLFHETGARRGIRPEHARRLARILSFWIARKRREMWICPAGGCIRSRVRWMDFGRITVSGNWRVVFRFSAGDVELVDYLDYH